MKIGEAPEPGGCETFTFEVLTLSVYYAKTFEILTIDTVVALTYHATCVPLF